jgi:hypothetical protein
MCDGAALGAECFYSLNCGKALASLVHSHQARYGIVAAGNDEVLASFNAHEQFGKMGLGFGNLYDLRHGAAPQFSLFVEIARN